MNDDNAKRDVETNRICGLIWAAAGLCTALLLLADSAFNILQ